MPRSVNHVASRARRKKILGLTKGYFGARKNVWTVAKNTWEKGLTYAYRDRKNKKRNFRALWIQRINAAARLEGMSRERYTRCRRCSRHSFSGRSSNGRTWPTSRTRTAGSY